MNLKRLKRKYDIDWITENGEFDYSKYPIEHPTKDSLSIVDQKFINACNVLGSMVKESRIDAGMFLIGLIVYYHGNFERLEILIGSLKNFKNEVCSDFLFDEIINIEINSENHRYIDSIIVALSGFPKELVKEKFIVLSNDGRYSDSMHNKFLKIIDRFERSGT